MPQNNTTNGSPNTNEERIEQTFRNLWVSGTSTTIRTVVAEEEPIFEENTTSPRTTRRHAQSIMNSLSDSIEVDDSLNDVGIHSIITTVSGKKLKASECILYRGDFYETTHKDIVKCSISNKFIHIGNACKVISNIQFKDDKVECEFCNIDKNFIEFVPFLYSYKYGIESRVLNEDIISKTHFKQATDQDCFIDIDKQQKKMQQARYYPAFKNRSKLVINNIKDEIKFGIKSPTNSIAEGLPYTMGVEIEISHGFIPVYKSLLNYNLSCVRDGSINGGEGGPEYVTGILKGDAGFKHLQDICLGLKDCRINHTCGVHVHLGGIDFTKQFLVNSYILAMLIEDELFTYLPKSRRNNRYCRKLKPLDLKVALTNSKDNFQLEADYNKLFKYISYEKVNNPSFEYNKSKQHPMGAKCGYNHDTPRYCWLNYVPAMFNTRGNGSYSLEIRNHSGTTNFIKIRNWILLFMAIVAFAERYPDLIKPGIKINDILDKIYPRKSNSLKLYFKTRQSKFSEDEEDSDLIEETTCKTIKELIKE